MNRNIIETKNLTKKFKDLVAVDNLNISIKKVKYSDYSAQMVLARQQLFLC